LTSKTATLMMKAYVVLFYTRLLILLNSLTSRHPFFVSTSRSLSLAILARRSTAIRSILPTLLHLSHLTPLLLSDGNSREGARNEAVHRQNRPVRQQQHHGRGKINLPRLGPRERRSSIALGTEAVWRIIFAEVGAATGKGSVSCRLYAVIARLSIEAISMISRIAKRLGGDYTGIM
jgi:hypothetical protein